MVNVRDDKRVSSPRKSEQGSQSPRSKRTYAPPRLTSYGRVIDVTLGGTPGAGDSSGDPFTENPIT